MQSGSEVSWLLLRSSLSKRAMRIEIKRQTECRTLSSWSGGQQSPVWSLAGRRRGRAYQRGVRDVYRRKAKSSLCTRPSLLRLQGRLQVLPVRPPIAIAPVQRRHALTSERSAKLERKDIVSKQSQSATSAPPQPITCVSTHLFRFKLEAGLRNPSNSQRMRCGPAKERPPARQEQMGAIP